jgi:outer membrane protein assembly factor BamB
VTRSSHIILLVTVLTPASGRAADWPQFRGDARQSGVAASGLPDDLVPRWTFKAGDSIEGAAAVADGVVYVASMDQHLYALDLATGKENWKYRARPFKAPPSYRSGLVYVGDEEGRFHCVDASTGKSRWTFEAGAEIPSGANFAGDAVLFGSADEHLYCLSPEGKLKWKFRLTGGPVMGSPAVVGDRVLVSGCDSTLHVLDAGTGKELAAVQLGGQTAAAPAVSGAQVYLPTMTNHVLAIDWKKAEVLWDYAAPRRQQPFYASAAVTDDLVIAGSRDKQVHAIDRKSGNPAWTFATRNRVDSSPVVVGRRVVVGSLDGNLYVLDLAKGTELKKLKLDGAIAASPAVAGECLVIGTTKGTVYCFAAGK